MEAIFIVVFTLLGLVVASFLNVCIDRLPSGQSLLFPASHCASCHHRLAIKDLIPVFSYLWLRGRCRYCGVVIPRRVLWVELSSAVLFGLACWWYGVSIELAIALFYICILMVIMVIDWGKGLILNKIVLPALGAALLISIIFSILLPDVEIVPFIGRAAAGGGIGLVLFFFIVVVSRGGMGWGDVKLAALIGLITGFPLVFIALLIGVILGGAAAVLLLAFKIKRRKETIPFGPFLVISTIVTLFWGNSILSWYRGLF